MISLRLRLRPDKEGKTFRDGVSAEALSEVGSSVERRRVRATAQFRFDTPSACGGLGELHSLIGTMRMGYVRFVYDFSSGKKP